MKNVAEMVERFADAIFAGRGVAGSRGRRRAWGHEAWVSRLEEDGVHNLCLTLNLEGASLLVSQRLEFMLVWTCIWPGWHSEVVSLKLSKVPR